jgi:hypothetical protein
VEFIAPPSENRVQQAIPIPEEGNLKKRGLVSFETRCRLSLPQDQKDWYD